MLGELLIVFGIAGPLAVVVEFGIVVAALAKGVEVAQGFLKK